MSEVANVGPLLGFSDGHCVGLVLGKTEGCFDFSSDGCMLGRSESATLGVMLGSEDGFPLGSRLGRDEGKSLLMLVGVCEGFMEAWMEGDEDGNAVGKEDDKVLGEALGG
mmetsp:Transcript_9424/g.17717  ORF Transcript_9424/g.17717 Transcript_9424/m.17717 type:complete len:110 (+) Transcript_9424:366-695(+)